MNKIMQIKGSFGHVIYFDNKRIDDGTLAPPNFGMCIIRLAALRASLLLSERIWWHGRFFIEMAQFEPPHSIVAVCFVRYKNQTWRVNLAGRHGQEIDHQDACELLDECSISPELFVGVHSFKNKN